MSFSIEVPAPYDRLRTTDSTCNVCFAIIATGVEDTDLGLTEGLRKCDPETLVHWTDLIQEIERSGRGRKRREG